MWEELQDGEKDMCKPILRFGGRRGDDINTAITAGTKNWVPLNKLLHTSLVNKILRWLDMVNIRSMVYSIYIYIYVYIYIYIATILHVYIYIYINYLCVYLHMYPLHICTYNTTFKSWWIFLDFIFTPPNKDFAVTQPPLLGRTPTELSQAEFLPKRWDSDPHDGHYKWWFNYPSSHHHGSVEKWALS